MTHMERRGLKRREREEEEVMETRKRVINNHDRETVFIPVFQALLCKWKIFACLNEDYFAEK